MTYELETRERRARNLVRIKDAARSTLHGVRDGGAVHLIAEAVLDELEARPLETAEAAPAAALADAVKRLEARLAQLEGRAAQAQAPAPPKPAPRLGDSWLTR